MTSGVDEGSSGLSPNEAFELLGHETRIAILQALWATFESAGRDNALSYTELFEQVDIRDSGNFSYHLQKLTGPFIRSVDEGYELKQTGINVMRAVVEGTVIGDPSFGPTPIDDACPICGRAIEIAYRDELMTVSCTECEGRIPWADDHGHLFGAPIPPAAIEGRPVEQAFQSGMVYTLYKLAAFIDGVCSDCSTEVDTSIDVCADHDPGEASRCPTCDRLNLAEVWMACPTCKLRVFVPVSLFAFNHPRVAALYHDDGIQFRFASWQTIVRSFQVQESLASQNPLRLHLEVSVEDDSARITLDRDLNVIDIRS